jgi:hypothetical protein
METWASAIVPVVWRDDLIGDIYDAPTEDWCVNELTEA